MKNRTNLDGSCGKQARSAADQAAKPAPAIRDRVHVVAAGGGLCLTAVVAAQEAGEALSVNLARADGSLALVQHVAHDEGRSPNSWHWAE